MAERFLWFLKVIYLIILSLPSPLRGQNKELKFNDPGLKDQWYLGKNAADDRHNNIWSAWQQGATGKGVRIALIDNGVEVTHNDLLDNIVTESSFNYGDFNRDLQPRKTRTPGHGTKMAGIIGMSANNNQCGVGIAYEAKISALTFGWTALAHAQSYTHRLNETDIYVSTTGPPDNGQFIAKHTKQVMKAYVKGITKGRRGLGSIYIRTSGSGGYHGDHCGADGTVNNLYSIAVASAAKDHSQTLLGEGCASILTSVYTQQTKWFVKGFTKDVITTDLKGSCTINSGGSSTAAAMVSAIVALALSVNQQLTWRDVQYLIIKSSNQNNLPVTWYTNGVGLRFNSRYGFGILDAGKMVTLSKTWKTTGVNMVSQKVLVTKSM
ncbi:furin-1-like isoform X1 [Clytia hemisphaerica]|uniref:Peptidase S8/S53 domain-containing protein n=1 Tax=Clytia hemisphaerica TaxID=252671 RepID=A0A7M6DQP9_9CNID